MAYRIRRQAGDETNHFLLVAGRFYFLAFKIKIKFKIKFFMRILYYKDGRNRHRISGIGR